MREPEEISDSVTETGGARRARDNEEAEDSLRKTNSQPQTRPARARFTLPQDEKSERLREDGQEG